MKKKKNFSLIEVVTAVVLLALAVGSTISIFGQGSFMSRRSKMRTIAYYLVQEKLEEKSVDSGSGFPPASEANAAVAGFTGFNRTVTVTNNFLFAGLSEIVVRVDWDNNAHNVTLYTLKARF